MSCVIPAPWAKAQWSDLLPVNTTQRKRWVMRTVASFWGTVVHTLAPTPAVREASGQAREGHPPPLAWRRPQPGPTPSLRLLNTPSHGHAAQRLPNSHQQDPGEGACCVQLLRLEVLCYVGPDNIVKRGKSKSLHVARMGQSPSSPIFLFSPM